MFLFRHFPQLRVSAERICQQICWRQMDLSEGSHIFAEFWFRGEKKKKNDDFDEQRIVAASLFSEKRDFFIYLFLNFFFLSNKLK